MAVRITLYAKAGCHLCEDAHGVVEDVRARLADVATRLEVVDITTESELLARYRHDVPVVAIEGVEAAGVALA